MNGKKTLITIMLSAMLFAGCDVKNNNAIIKVNDRVVTQKQFDELLEKQIAASPFAKMGDLKSNKEGFMYLMTAQGVVNQLVTQQLIYEEADKRKIKVSSKEVDDAIAKLMEKVGGRERMAEMLKQNNISASEFKQNMKDQLRMQKLMDVVGKIKVTDAETKAFYDKNLDKFKHGDQVRASHILISANPYQISQEINSNPKVKLGEKELKEKVDKVIAEKKAKADKIAKELQADSSKFVSYVKKYSDDTNSATMGGDLGFFDKEHMVPEFSKAAFSMKPNTISKPVQSQFGYHIILVTDRRSAGVEPYAKVKNDLNEYLVFEKRKATFDKLVETAKKTAKIEYIDKSLDPEVINKKLHNQVNDLTNGAKDRADAQAKKEAEKKQPAKK